MPKYAPFFVSLTVFVFSLLISPAAPVEAAVDASRIRTIAVYGNKVTKEKTIRAFLTFDTGMVYDSAQAVLSKKYLLGTQLFSHVDILGQPMADGVHVYVIVVEKTYYGLSDIGGELYDGVHGSQTQRWWWRARLGVSYDNFRGAMEKLSVAVSIWDWRSLAVSWFKPFLRSPYFVAISAAVSQRPDLFSPLDRFNVNQSTTIGRKMGAYSNVYVRLMPAYTKETWVGPGGQMDSLTFVNTDWRGDSLQAQLPPRTSSASWTDTLRANDSLVTRYQWTDSGQAIATREHPYTELFVGTGWSTDLRDTRYDTRNGTYWGIDITSNVLRPREPEDRYVQFDTDVRAYHRAILASHTMAYRLRTTLRVGSPGAYEGLYAGGAATLRGYPLGYLPRFDIANDRVLFTGEYRLPIVKTPEVDLPVLSDLHSGLRDFYYRFDAAAFVDAAYLWHDLGSPIVPQNEHSKGVGAGLGLRLMAPTLERSACLDVAWGLDKQYLQMLRATYRAWRDRWMPQIHLYVDMYF